MDDILALLKSMFLSMFPPFFWFLFICIFSHIAFFETPEGVAGREQLRYVKKLWGWLTVPANFGGLTSPQNWGLHSCSRRFGRRESWPFLRYTSDESQPTCFRGGVVNILNSSLPLLCVSPSSSSRYSPQLFKPKGLPPWGRVCVCEFGS